MAFLRCKRNYRDAKKPVIAYQITTYGVNLNFAASKHGKREVETYRDLVDRIESERAKRGKVYDDTLDDVKKYPTLYRKLIERGVLDAPPAEFWTLEQLRREYIEAGEREGKTENTLRNQTNSLLKLEEYFETITLDELDADAARTYADVLDGRVAEGMISGATRAGYIRDVKRAFNWAVESGIVAVNPFDGIKKGSFRNEARKVYINQELTRAVLEACRNSDHPLEWRALFALARYQGLRIPSEPRALRWKDVDFDRRQMTITSQKTKRHEGKGMRVMPIFEPTRAILQELREAQPKNQVFVFADLLPQMRAESNIRTGFLRILKRAGLEPWTAIFQNLRKSAGTDVADRYGTTAESRWLGHSEKVADEHYLQVLPTAQNDEGGLFADWQ